MTISFYRKHTLQHFILLCHTLIIIIIIIIIITIIIMIIIIIINSNGNTVKSAYLNIPRAVNIYYSNWGGRSTKLS